MTADQNQAAPAQGDTALAAKLVSGSAAAARTDQIVLVVDHELSFWQKGTDGQFSRVFYSYCGYGRSGFTSPAERVEGDGSTPIGSYPLTYAFGIASNPGTSMEYRQVTKDSYWSGDPEDYNQWTETNTRSMPNSEHLIDYQDAYQYAMVIGYNMNPVTAGKGSGIFLHCKRTGHWYTAGCVSIPEPLMKELLQKCHAGAWILIGRNLADIEALK